MALTNEQLQKLVKLELLKRFRELADIRYLATINDLSTIRSGAAAGATAYQLPENGIPATDLAQAVQDALTSAGTALQASDLETLNGKIAALESLITEDDPRGAIDKFNEIVEFLEGIDSESLQGVLSGINDAIAAKYTKPSNGIPYADLSSEVKASLDKADTALLEHQDISGKVDKEIIGANGKALVFNESDGGGVKFEHSDGTWSFAGVNDGGENGIAGQIYALKKNADDKFEGARIDVTKNGIYYTVGAASVEARLVNANKIATLGDIAAGIGTIETATDEEVEALFA